MVGEYQYYEEALDNSKNESKKLWTKNIKYVIFNDEYVFQAEKVA